MKFLEITHQSKTGKPKLKSAILVHLHSSAMIIVFGRVKCKDDADWIKHCTALEADGTK